MYKVQFCLSADLTFVGRTSAHINAADLSFLVLRFPGHVKGIIQEYCSRYLLISGCWPANPDKSPRVTHGVSECQSLELTTSLSISCLSSSSIKLVFLSYCTNSIQAVPFHTSGLLSFLNYQFLV